ncbi:MAG: DUF2189 domain-containing protein [Caulobacter sp.]|nr:DUF2189 domain-containing protein [Caulobacter sp.]
MTSTLGLPPVRLIGFGAPFGWLAGALGDMGRALVPCLIYGLGMAAVSIGICYALYSSNMAFWALTLTLGFVFVAPMLAMGLYEAGRRLERGEKPRLGEMLLLPSAFRQDTAYLGLALLLIYLLWGRFAQVVYGLSTYQSHRTIAEFTRFALETGEGHNMLITGTIVGGAIAFFTFTLVVVTAPMLLDRQANVFAATATSFRAVAANPGPMLLWAAIIVVLMLLTAATGFLAMIVVFPWLGLASWRAYRALVAEEVGLAAAA